MPQTTLDSGLPPTPLYLDKKRFAWLFSVIGPGLPLVGTVAVSFFDVGTWILFFPLVFFYGLIPLLDFYLGEDTNNPPESEVPALERDIYYRAITYATIPVLWVAVIFN
jgi:alkane 1-monooxygenase